MKFKVMTRAFALALLAGVVSLTTGAAPVSAQSGRSGMLHVTKSCSGTAPFCTITSSNLAEIKAGSKIFYDTVAILPTPTGIFDSLAVIYVGTGDFAVGRCTLDNTSNLGICTFSDGVGGLTGFQARIDVSSTDGINYTWNGTYRFTPEPDR